MYTPLVPPSPLLGIPPIDFFNDINNLGGPAFPTTIRLSDGRCLKMRHVSICYMLHIATSRKTLHVSLCDKSHFATRPKLRQSQNDTRPKTLHVSKRVMYRFATRSITLHGCSRLPRAELVCIVSIHGCSSCVAKRYTSHGLNRFRFEFEPKPPGLNWNPAKSFLFVYQSTKHCLPNP